MWLMLRHVLLVLLVGCVVDGGVGDVLVVMIDVFVCGVLVLLLALLVCVLWLDMSLWRGMVWTMWWVFEVVGAFEYTDVVVVVI